MKNLSLQFAITYNKKKQKDVTQLKIINIEYQKV